MFKNLNWGKWGFIITFIAFIFSAFFSYLPYSIFAQKVLYYKLVEEVSILNEYNTDIKLTFKDKEIQSPFKSKIIFKAQGDLQDNWGDKGYLKICFDKNVNILDYKVEILDSDKKINLTKDADNCVNLDRFFLNNGDKLNIVILNDGKNNKPSIKQNIFGYKVLEYDLDIHFISTIKNIYKIASVIMIIYFITYIMLVHLVYINFLNNNKVKLDIIDHTLVKYKLKESKIHQVLFIFIICFLLFLLYQILFLDLSSTIFTKKLL